MRGETYAFAVCICNTYPNHLPGPLHTGEAGIDRHTATPIAMASSAASAAAAAATTAGPAATTQQGQQLQQDGYAFIEIKGAMAGALRCVGR